MEPMNRNMKLKNTKTALCLMIVLMVVISMFGSLSANSLNVPAFHLSTFNAPKDRSYMIVIFHEEHAGLMDNYFPGNDDDDPDREEAVARLNSFLADYEDPDGLLPSPVKRLSRGNARIPLFGYVSEDKDLRIMVYYPDNGEYMISDIFHAEGRYDEYSVDLSTEGPRLKVKDYSDNYARKNLAIVTTINLLFTMTVETGIAALLGYRSKKEIKTILLTNLVTNLTANILAIIFVRFYIIVFTLLEAFIIAAEYAVYDKTFPREKKRSSLFGYVFGANAFSALFGLFVLGVVHFFVTI